MKATGQGIYEAYRYTSDPTWEELTALLQERYERAARRIQPASSDWKLDIVCLCGSTRFIDAFHEANLRETLGGKIVLSIGCDTKSDTDLLLAGQLTYEDKERLDELHLRKIYLADEILVLNVGGYIGHSTRREIEYAKAHGKRIRYLETTPE